MRWLLPAACVLLTVGGCAHVSPWERGDLARVQRVEESRAPSRHYEAHLWSVRSGMSGGTGEPGGGCGCN